MNARPANKRRRSLAGKLAFGLCLFTATSIALALGLARLFGDPWLAGVVSLLLLVPFALWLVRRTLAPVLSMFRALSGTVTSYRDGDYSFGLAWKRNDELGDLVAAHNALGDALREQRVALVQRELLLDTMVQNTPVAMLLADNAGRIVYSNLASRKLLNNGRRLEGEALDTLLHGAPEPLREAIERGGDGLFAVGHDDDEQIFHLARRGFRLNGRRHELFLLRHLTAELRRQEVQTWKKVIRIISHELNNSLAPIASLAHSGAELVRREQYQRLEEIFGTIEERARHLEGFIRDYARFAKLPAPRLEPIVWSAFCDRLNSQIGFTLDGSLPEKAARLDAAQLEQALLNLLKNAHESGSAPEHVSLRVRRFADALRIDVNDRGSGMNEAVLANALVPFYSTKRSGTGLGLALAREIAEAHGGRIALSNRVGGGLSVTLVIPE
ncbi:MAG TPA: ATP-binding protein [Xanthomonadaceae bacterium]|nr:ATP-binding protein [Xanthomonadaceae bacterium]